MRGASQNYDIQKWGILHNYRTALEHEAFEKAEAIIQANPEVPRAEFTRVYEETFHAPSGD
jgi:hypothetical protein